ncbi:MAG: hypothetical protein VX739_09925, partial [Planctomycetota bacterium]|nr:hypothetical protein [Planctomycetota bacterium]
FDCRRTMTVNEATVLYPKFASSVFHEFQPFNYQSVFAKTYHEMSRRQDGESCHCGNVQRSGIRICV